MDETEKMTALKKAYADIILNTAKEAAARVMTSERRAQAVHHELKEAKEEALRLLLRMKHMMDSKISKAEARSQIQQRRIEELEAQLQEAEDIVGNLRAELSETQAELERMVKNLRENYLVDGEVHLERTELQEIGAMNSGLMACSLQAEESKLQENGQKDSGLTTCTLEAKEAVVVTALEPEVAALNAAIDANGHLDIHLRDHCCVGSPDFASIMVRSKEPELYKNGCTQRIRAFERKLLNGHLSLLDELDDMKNEKVVRGDKEDKKICSTHDCGAEICCSTVERNLAEAKGVGRAATNGFRGKSCRKWGSITDGCIRPCNSKTVIAPIKETDGGAVVSDNESSPAAMEVADISHTNETNTEHSVSDMRAECDARVMSNASRNASLTHNEADKDPVIDEDMEVVNSLVMFSQESVSGNARGVSSCQAQQLEEQNGASADPNAQVSDATIGVPDQDSTDDRLLKYTFQRKRKKASATSDNNHSARHEEGTLIKRTGKKRMVNSGERKSDSIVGPSRDSRRMAQVARQLISLSEKRWWK